MIKLMIAEDEAMERKALNFLLDKNYKDKVEKVEEVMTGNDAIARALVKEPDIILMDIKMTGLDGLKAGEIIKNELPQTEIVILTAYSEFDYARKAVQIGADNYLLKPYSEEEFKDTLDKLITKIEKKDQEKRRQNLLRNKLNNMTSLLEKEIVFSIIYDNLPSEKLEEYRRLLGIKGNESRCLVIALDEDDLNVELLLIIKKIIKKFIPEVIGYIGLKNMVFLMFGNELSKLESQNTFKRLKSSILDELKYRNIDEELIGLGNISKDNDLYHSYTQALSQLDQDKQNSILNGNIINESDIPIYPFKRESQLSSKIINADLEGALSILNEIFDYVLTNNEQNGEERLKDYLIQLMIIVNRNINEFLGYKKILLDIHELEEDFQRISEIKSLKLYIQKRIKNLIKIVEEYRQDRDVRIIEEVKNYIKRNYADNISLEEIADDISFSKYYLSKLFKKVVGINFKDYLIKIRMDNAKKLLKKNMKIKDVSNQVGYQDANYFSRAFKKYTGITPSKYK